MPDFSSETSHFIHELDTAVEAHMGWTRRVLRCAVLGTSPGEDVLTPMAHTLCRFGRWFVPNKEQFAKIDAQKTVMLEAVHQRMHEAIRSICTDMLAGRKGQSIDLDVFEQTQSHLIHLLAEFKTQVLANATRHDPLTGLPLRYGLEIEFEKIQKNCARNHQHLFAALIDVDHFKQVNDTHGHAIGDKALCHIAKTLRTAIRANEPLFRFGGEEFLLLMQCQSREAATMTAQRIVQAVRSAPMHMTAAPPLSVTVTLGLAQVSADEDMTSAIDRADKALYAGKNAGRDRYVVAGDSSP